MVDRALHGVVAVVADAEERWGMGAALGLDPGAALGREEARARVAHPCAAAPDAIVLVLRDDEDAAWLDWQRRASTRRAVPVVALVDDVDVAAQRHAGADAVVSLRGDAPVVLDRVRAAVAAVRGADGPDARRTA